MPGFRQPIGDLLSYDKAFCQAQLFEETWFPPDFGSGDCYTGAVSKQAVPNAGLIHYWRLSVESCIRGLGRMVRRVRR